MQIQLNNAHSNKSGRVSHVTGGCDFLPLFEILKKDNKWHLSTELPIAQKSGFKSMQVVLWG